MTAQSPHLLTVRELRQQRSWGQVELAYHAHIAVSSVSLIEQGKQIPRVDVAQRIARAFGVSTDDIVWGKPEGKSGDPAAE